MWRAGNRDLQEVKEGEGRGAVRCVIEWTKSMTIGGLIGYVLCKSSIEAVIIIHFILVTPYLPHVHMSAHEDRLVVNMRTDMRVIRQEDKLLPLQDAVSDAGRWLMIG